MQAYVDGELRASERAIFEEHLGDCIKCQAVLARHRRTSARLYEALAPHQLQRDLTADVMAHLPTMDHVQEIAREVTWRVKHPRRFGSALRILVPAVVPLVLLVLGLAIYVSWPDPVNLDREVVGMVVQREGEILKSDDASVERHPVPLEASVASRERFETGGDSALMIALSGPSHVKVDRNTRVKILDGREVSVESGRIWLDVCKARRKFHVATPQADIIVFGTRFAVEVADNRTVVTVEEGEVTVELGERFAVLHAGDQLDLGRLDDALVPRTVPLGKETAWAKRIQPDPAAQARFHRELRRTTPEMMLADQVYRLPLQGQPVESVILFWEPADGWTHCAGYTVYLFDEHMDPVLRQRVDGELLGDPDRSSVELVVMPDGEPLVGMDVLYIKTVPDLDGPSAETEFTEVATRIYQ